MSVAVSKQDYGARSAIIVLLLWLYLMAYAVLFGAAMTRNSSVRRNAIRLQAPNDPWVNAWRMPRTRWARHARSSDQGNTRILGAPGGSTAGAGRRVAEAPRRSRFASSLATVCSSSRPGSGCGTRSTRWCTHDGHCGASARSSTRCRGWRSFSRSRTTELRAKQRARWCYPAVGNQRLRTGNR